MNNMLLCLYLSYILYIIYLYLTDKIMSQDHAIYDDELQDFIYTSKYNFTKFKKKIEKHFKEGGLSSNPVIAGVCGVTRGTIISWRNKNSQYYKEEFDLLISNLENHAILITDKWHRESAAGKRKDANPQTLNRRAERLLDLTQTINTVQKIEHKYESVEEIDDEIKKIQEEADNQ